MAVEAPVRADPPSYRWAILAIGVLAQTSFSAVFFGLPILALAAGAFLASLASAGFLRDPAGSGARRPTPLRAALHDHFLWRLSAGSALLVVAQISVLGFTVLFLHDERGLSPAAAGGVVALMQVLGGVLRIASGHWSDRVGTRIAPLLRIGGALAAALALSALVVGAPLLVLLPALVVAGSLSAGWNGLSFTAAAELAGQARAGAAIGLQQASLALAAAVTPVVFAAIVEQASWSVAFGFAGAVALLGTWALVPLAAREPLLEARR